MREQLIELARQQYGDDRLPALTQMIDAYWEHVPERFRSQLDAPGLWAFLAERFRFLEEVPERLPRIRIADRPSGMAFIAAAFDVLECRSVDRTFIVKTLRMFLHDEGIEIQHAMNPVLGVTRDATGRVAALDPRAREGERISHIYFHIAPVPAERRVILESELARRYHLLTVINQDFAAMTRQAARCIELLRQPDPAVPADEVARSIEFVRWMIDDGYIFLGAGWYPAEDDPTPPPPPLGLLQPGVLIELGPRVDEIVRTRRGLQPLIGVHRTDIRSPVKSSAQLRYVGVRVPGAHGAAPAEVGFVGLLSSKASGERNSEIPILAEKLAEVMRRLDLRRGSFDYKGYWTTLNAIPSEDLFYSSVEEIIETARFIHEGSLSSRVRVRVGRSPRGTRIAVLALVPRSHYSEGQRGQVLRYLCEELAVGGMRDYVRDGDPDTSIRQLHFYVSFYREGVSDDDLQRIAAEVTRLLETWPEQLQATIEARFPEEPFDSGQLRGSELLARYLTAFPHSYQEAHSVEVALEDIAALERLAATDQLQVRMVEVALDGGPTHVSLRVTSPERLPLGVIVPVLNSIGLSAIGRFSIQLAPRDRPPVQLYSFAVTLEDGRAIAEGDRARLRSLVEEVLVGQRENDGLLGLATRAGLTGHEIDVLSTYRSLFYQLYRGFSRQTLNDTLLRHPGFARRLVEYFVVRFDPDDRLPVNERLSGPLAPLARQLRAELGQVATIQDAQILERLLDLVVCTLRTNHFRRSKSPCVAVKLDSMRVKILGTPRPHVEIYVRGRHTEGIHLRGGPVARGGIRASDRSDDFRSEVLGLMQTQMTKNSVIVPVGSKGGFVVRRQHAGRAAQEAEVAEQYKVFIGGLLDLTDNVVGGKVVPPDRVVAYDGPDPYLVVAADKGTARLSDTANELSQRYRFWLGDAFASGGSAGYDHKAMGITARGAWVSVERHFRELGIDLREHSIRVVGVGDMSGDVFGNGMLLNDKIRLVAAFNHRHVFLDPAPDPAVSFAERRRLFELPSSAWTDYDAALLSAGGGVFDRDARQIPLAPEVQALLGTELESASGPELIRLILRCEADLLWLGGIGTYVKAGDETHADVADQANDGVRIDAVQLRVRVVGEGANLGLTARARTQLALAGVHLNTDAVDNSAGVNCSDHEVNLKIMLAELLREGELADVPERNRLLVEMTDEVALRVLRSNYKGSAAISLEQLRCREDIEPLIDLLHALEAGGRLDRDAERLVSDDQLRAWHQAGIDIPRNQLCVMLSYAKMAVYERILQSAIPDRSLYGRILLGYFPKAMIDRFGDRLLRHPLRREIIATRITNALIDQAGSTFFLTLEEIDRRFRLDEQLERYLICDALLDGWGLREQIHKLDNQVAAETQYRALLALEETLHQMVRWWNWNASEWQLEHEQVPAVQTEVRELRQALAPLADPNRHPVRDPRLPSELADELAHLPQLSYGLSLLSLARQSNRPLDEVARTFFGLRERTGLDGLESALGRGARNAWESRFQLELYQRLSQVTDQLALHVLRNFGGDVEAYVAAAGPDLQRLTHDAQQIPALPINRLVPIHLTLLDLNQLLGQGTRHKTVSERRKAVTQVFKQM